MLITATLGLLPLLTSAATFATHAATTPVYTKTHYGSHAVPNKAAQFNSTLKNPFPISNLTWIGALERGGPNVTFTGHPEHLASKIKAANPYWMREGSHPDSPVPTGSANQTYHLEKRGRIGYQCNQGQYERGISSAASAGGAYIRDHFANAICQVQPYSCVRFSCSYNTATLLCNPTIQLLTIPCAWMAKNINFLWEQCGHYGYDYYIEGQAFYEQPVYNVLIKKTDQGREC